MKTYEIRLDWLNCGDESAESLCGTRSYIVKEEEITPDSRLERISTLSETLYGSHIYFMSGDSAFTLTKDGSGELMLKIVSPSGNLRWDNYKTVLVPLGQSLEYYVSHYQTTMGDTYDEFSEKYRVTFREL